MKTSIILFFASLQLMDATLTIHNIGFLVIPGSGIMQYIKTDDNEVIHHCYLSFETQTNNYTISILLNEHQDFSSTPVFGNRLSNLQRNTCGFTIVDIKHEDPAEFKISANFTDAENNEQFYEHTFAINLYVHATIKNTVQEVELGTKVVVTCGIQNVQKSCTLFDPKGVMVLRGQKKCDYVIKYVTMEHMGNWTCIPNLMQSMRPLKEVMTLRVFDKPIVDTWYKEKDGYGMIGCQYNDHGLQFMEFCEFVNPRNTRYHFARNSATQRYTTTGIDLLKSRCQIEFKLPILEEELGTWKCIVNKKLAPTGGFVDVYPLETRGAHIRPKRSSDYPKRTTQYVEIGAPFSLNCRVPYSTNNCYIKSPTDEYLYGGGLDYFNLGECSLKQRKAQKSDLGIWSCHFSREDQADDEVIEVEVIEEYSLRVVNNDVEAISGRSSELMCKATTPILSCLFVGPTGLTYNVSPEKKSKGINYAGRGFEYGECGLKIDSVGEEFNGVWTCVINNKGEVTRSLKGEARVSVSSFPGLPTSNAATVGIGIGIMAVAVLMLGVALFRRFMKPGPRANARTSTNSNGSKSDIPIFNMENVVYNTNNS